MDARWLLLVGLGGVAGGVAGGLALARRRPELGPRQDGRDEPDPILAFAASEWGHVYEARGGTKNTRRQDKSTPPLRYVDGPAAYDLRDMSAKYSMGQNGAMHLRFAVRGQAEVEVYLEPETRFSMPDQIGQLYSVRDSEDPMIKAVLDELVKSAAAVVVPVNLIVEPRVKGSKRP